MAVNEIHLNDLGTALRILVKDGTATVDISGASTKNIILKKPSGVVMTKTADFTTDGTDGKLEYITATADINEWGPWKIQANIITASTNFKSDIGEFTVYVNL